MALSKADFQSLIDWCSGTSAGQFERIARTVFCLTYPAGDGGVSECFEGNLHYTNALGQFAGVLSGTDNNGVSLVQINLQTPVTVSFSVQGSEFSGDHSDPTPDLNLAQVGPPLMISHGNAVSEFFWLILSHGIAVNVRRLKNLPLPLGKAVGA
jgi:hypothetical protein